ncbi:MAG: hypothetical protein LBH52_04215 [Puniceicoccales bacterium]|jgi:hypothetical protein|nr:hypothetical protein [Puniceicoccales bacterium]
MKLKQHVFFFATCFVVNFNVHAGSNNGFIELSKDLRSYLANMIETEGIQASTQVEKFDIDQLVKDKSISGVYAYDVCFLNKDELKLLLYRLYQMDKYPINKEALYFLGTVLTMVLKNKEYVDSPQVDVKNLRLFDTELKRLQTIVNQLK